MEGINLEQTLGFGILGAVAGNLLGNVIAYHLIYQRCYQRMQENVRSAENHAKIALDIINKKGWIYSNFAQIGSRMAYEKFLEDTKI